MKKSLLATFLATVLLMPVVPAFAAQDPLTNADIVRLARSGISDSVLASMVRSAPGHYNLSPDAVMALKNDGAGDGTIKAMLESASAKPANAVLGSAVPATLAARVSFNDGSRRRDLSPKLAKIAQSQFNGGGVSGGGVGAGMLSGFAGSALSMVPGVGMLGGVVGGIGSLLGHHKAAAPQIHQVWALEGSHATNELANSRPTFEVAYDNIPGIDPDRFVPTILHLVATKDNWRLVGASKSTVDMTKNMTGGTNIDSIDEERVAGHVVSLGRGRASFTPDAPLASGEYAVVLRLGDVKKTAEGEGSSQTLSSVIASVWDFSITGTPVPANHKPQ